MRIDWRDHLRWTEVDGRSVHYVELGAGPPLLLLHGLSCTWRIWLENMPALSRHHRVIAPDLPGFGASDLPEEPISMGAYVNWAVRFLAHLGIEQADFVGSSMGGFAAAEAAIGWPEVVRRMVLISPAGISIQSIADHRYFRLLRKADLELAGTISGGTTRLALRRTRLRNQLLRLVFANPEKVSAEMVAELGWGFGKPGFGPALSAMLTEPLRGRLGAIGCPTLIVWGESDHLTPMRDADRFRREIPGAQIRTIPGAGHLSMVEEPGFVTRLIEDFVGAGEPASADRDGAL
jgi:pimeloyl-ACP methyl ester carboxylesterase